MRALLTTFSWQELRHHPWRNAAAVLAVMLGVALAFSVQLINASALDEFSSAVRSVNGQPDLEVRAVQGGFDEAVFARIAQHPQVTLASPVLEFQGLALAAGERQVPMRVIGVDALVLPAPTASRCSRPAMCSSTTRPAARWACRRKQPAARPRRCNCAAATHGGGSTWPATWRPAARRSR